MYEQMPTSQADQNSFSRDTMKVTLRDFFIFARNTTVEVHLDEPGGGEGKIVDGKTTGWYSFLGNDQVGLFVARNKIFIVLNEKVVEVPAEKTETSHSINGEQREFNLRVGPEVYQKAYANPRMPVSTQFYSESEEDADFGLWLHNVLSSPERGKIVLNRWTNGI